MNPAQPEATAVAISDGRFLAVGSGAAVLALAGARTRRIDCAHRRVLPGFNDAHAHPWWAGIAALKNVACDKTSIEEILSALRARAAETLTGHWVQGYLYDDGKTPRFLTRADLDAAAPEHPVLVQHRGGHTGYVNSLALAAVGATATTPDPPGGRFEHDANGELNGRVADKALELISWCSAKTRSCCPRMSGRGSTSSARCSAGTGFMRREGADARSSRAWLRIRAVAWPRPMTGEAR